MSRIPPSVMQQRAYDALWSLRSRSASERHRQRAEQVAGGGQSHQRHPCPSRLSCIGWSTTHAADGSKASSTTCGSSGRGRKTASSRGTRAGRTGSRASSPSGCGRRGTTAVVDQVTPGRDVPLAGGGEDGGRVDCGEELGRLARRRDKERRPTPQRLEARRCHEGAPDGGDA